MLLAESPEQLGSVSFGRANRGWQLNAAQLPEGPHWHRVEPGRAWATQETVEALTRAITEVAGRFPGGRPLQVGQLSAPRGGYLRPHRSHQSGRDVDLGYYYVDASKWYTRATPQNLDVVRTWALVEALLRRDSVEYIFVDRSVERLLRAHAELLGNAASELERIFEGTRAEGAVVRHTWGHLTHMHVRFRSARAVALGARLLRADHRRVIALRRSRAARDRR